MPINGEVGDLAGSTATTATMTSGDFFYGDIDAAGDHDWIAVNLTAGVTYSWGLTADGVAFADRLHDSYLRLRDSTGTLQVASNDDGGPGLYSDIQYTATTTGVFYIDVASFYSADTSGDWYLSMTTGDRPIYNEWMAIADLTRSETTWSATYGTGATVTYGFRQSVPGYTTAGSNTIATFTQLNGVQMQAVRAALAAWSELSGIVFVEQNPGGYTDTATMLFGNYSDPLDGAGAFAYFPGDTAAGAAAGDVFLNLDSVSTTDLSVGTYSYFTLMHEIGHALGLSHPGDYNAAPGVSITYNANAQFVEDSEQYTIMSYFNETDTGSSYPGRAQNPMVYDIAAIQALYGVNYATRDGATVYGHNSTETGIYNFATNSIPAFTIFDGGGTDRLDASGFSAAQTLDLRLGAFSSIGGYTNNIAIAWNTFIDNATGGSGFDRIYGSFISNVLDGGVGNDTMEGFESDDSYYVNTGGDVVIETAGNGFDTVFSLGSYTLAAGVDIQRLRTTNEAGVTTLSLTGNAIAQEIRGNAGANALNGGAGGGDTMIGLGGNDTYYVDAPNDVVTEAANLGFDTVVSLGSYTLGALADIQRLMTTNTAGVTALSLTGNGIAQEIRGNAGANSLNGGAGGGDTMIGYGGNDTYFIDSTTDVVIEAAGFGFDTIASLGSYTLANGVDIQRLMTTNSAGVVALSLTGNDLAQEVRGNNGNNVINGGRGNDTLMGFGGSDTFSFNSTLGATNVDTITDFNVVADTIRLENAIFTGVGAAGGVVAFALGAGAATIADRIIYNSANGDLFYDVDGLGGISQVLFARLGVGLGMTAADFSIV